MWLLLTAPLVLIAYPVVRIVYRLSARGGARGRATVLSLI